MKKINVIILSLALAGVSLTGCSSQPVAERSSLIIEESKTQSTVEAQGQFLIDQTHALVAGKEYKDAINVAKYVMANFENKAPEARDILMDIQEKLQDAIREKMRMGK
jgi:hypothetical protein